MWRFHDNFDYATDTNINWNNNLRCDIFTPTGCSNIVDQIWYKDYIHSFDKKYMYQHIAFLHLYLVLKPVIHHK